MRDIALELPADAFGASAAADCPGVSPGAAILLRSMFPLEAPPPSTVGIFAAIPSALLI